MKLDYVLAEFMEFLWKFKPIYEILQAKTPTQLIPKIKLSLSHQSHLIVQDN